MAEVERRHVPIGADVELASYIVAEEGGGGGSAPEAWHNVGDSGEPAFENGATNAGGVMAPVGFYKDGDRVYLRGALTGFGAVVDTFVFTLPDGYRPPYVTVTEGWVLLDWGGVQYKALRQGNITLDGISFRVS